MPVARMYVQAHELVVMYLHKSIRSSCQVRNNPFVIDCVTTGQKQEANKANKCNAHQGKRQRPVRFYFYMYMYMYMCILFYFGVNALKHEMGIQDKTKD